MTETKICKTCKLEKPLNREYFRLSKRHKDGFNSECKECSKKKSKEYRDKNRDKILEYQREYYKNNPEQARQSRKKYRENNKEKVKEIVKNWEERNKEKRRAYHKEWYQANKKRKRKNERKLYLKSEKHRKYKNELSKIRKHRKRSVVSDFTPFEWKECTNYFNNECCYCGSKSDKLEQDHFIPVAKKGPYTKTNIVPACGSCNSSKNDRDFFEWYPKQNYYSIERENKILSYLGREVKHDSLQIQRK